jgi:hypothetical protein
VHGTVGRTKPLKKFDEVVPMQKAAHKAPPKAAASLRKSILLPINELTEQLDKTVGELEKAKRDNFDRKFR